MIIWRSIKKDEGEKGLLVKYFIKYKNNNIIQALKKEHYLLSVI